MVKILGFNKNASPNEFSKICNSTKWTDHKIKLDIINIVKSYNYI